MEARARAFLDWLHGMSAQLRDDQPTWMWLQPTLAQAVQDDPTLRAAVEARVGRLVDIDRFSAEQLRALNITE